MIITTGHNQIWTETRRGNFDNVVSLLNGGADPNELGGYPCFCPPLELAVYYGNNEMVNLLLENGADVEKCNYNGETPLHVSLSRVQREITDMLLDFGADIEAKDKRGKTVLYTAAQFYSANKLQYLIAKGADVNTICIVDGSTPLMGAVGIIPGAGGDPEKVRILLDSGANLFLRNHRGETAEDLAYYLQPGTIFQQLHEERVRIEQIRSFNRG
jgi:ankyrin repeat protein